MAAITIAVGADATGTPTISGTDIAGTITLTPKATITTGVAATVTFGYAYNDIGSGASAAQIILTPTNLAAAVDMNKIYVSATTTTTFTISIRAGCTASSHTYNYHIIETQSGNGSSPFGGITYGGSPAWTASSIAQGTDVAGRITINVIATAGSVTFAFGTAYDVAPIVVVGAMTADAAIDFGKFWITTTTTNFTINYAATAAGKTAIFAYHVIETQ